MKNFAETHRKVHTLRLKKKKLNCANLKSKKKLVKKCNNKNKLNLFYEIYTVFTFFAFSSAFFKSKFKSDLLFAHAIKVTINDILHRKIVYNNGKTKNNFFHDRRLEGTCYDHLVKHSSTIHLVAHKSFRFI